MSLIITDLSTPHFDQPSTIDQLVGWMRNNCYNFDSYSINGNHIHEGYGIEKYEDKFFWYYTERGQKNVLEEFRTEREVVLHALEALQDDRWAKTHCIGFVFIKALHEELATILQKLNVEFTQDRILYSSPDRYAYRTFVFGCDVRKTSYLKEQFYHAP